jgi:predicted membrane protein
MADQNPGGDLGERIRRDVHDEIHSRLDRKRMRWEAKMERRRQRYARMGYGRSHPFGGLLIGVILAGAGVLLLLQNLGIPFMDEVWDYWPVILIVIGGSRLASAWDLGGRIFGGIVMFVGGVFLLRNLGLLHGSVWQYFWPVMLIAIGLGLLIRALEGNHAWDLWTHNAPSSSTSTMNPGMAGAAPIPPRPPLTDISNSFKEDHIFSGAKRRIETQDFEGGEALAIFGGMEIDLRKADTKREQVFIESNAIFGGIEIRVPETWRVTMRGTGIFGGFNDETVQPMSDAKAPHLIVTGAAIFGGVNVKN